ncbi:MAG: hypothetical protein EOP64_00285 [Sphingomonas sp.]|nr:MAG: hypothetical protein EOP64_00285 [Sphingomonas sp.]
MKIVKNAAGLHEAEIAGHAYEFQKWAAEESLDALLDLSIIMGKPLAAIAERGGAKADLDSRAIEGLVDALTSNLSSNRQMVMALVKKLATGKMLCDGKEVASFNVHYDGRLSHAFEVVRANLEVQFGHFFSGMAALMPKDLPAKAAASSTAPR